MAEYIKREDALHALCEAVHKNKNVPCRNQIVSCLWEQTGVHEYAEKIYSIPAADVVERKKGKWIDMGDFEQCSACKGTHLKEFESYYGKVTWTKTPYCHNCGADMRELPKEG